MSKHRGWGCFNNICCMGLACALAGGAQAQPVTAPAATTRVDATRPFQERMQWAARLYDELEYEQALASLADAKALARTDDERADALIYEGIVLADLRQQQQSRAAFRQGLLLQPEVLLPIKVSPKVQRDFENLRDEVRGKLGLPLGTARAPVTDSDRPERPSNLSPATPRSSHPGLDAVLVPTKESPTKVRALPLTFAGVGALTAGVGGVFGLLSRGNVKEARKATTLDSQRENLDSARGEALAANLLFGLAAASVTSAVILYLTSPSESDEVAQP
ncbi:hypothetical protein SAMN05443572_108254 [Myxococcus fulvus]|uniref:TPR domain-containing protein n=1 Tax=Myxococcus fulvus TaxID=33 RepID=A0A511T3G0_MYXFU|nr:tetratricopeptide repeat protein [Myxococcus fulvus]GEN08704.1 hypothetical protein MFU01_37410 [Myxococcus fulvus]SEU29834.1 hypothetical protein SAMN05443572_108254 [Myxococcus fulvus]